MIFKRSTPPPVALPHEKDTVQKVVDYRMSAFFHRVAAVAFAVGTVFLVVKTEVWYPLCVLSLTVTLLIRAHWIEGYAKREAEKLPQAPKRERGPSLWQRLAWWIARRRMVATATAPYRGIRVAGVDDAIQVPYLPGEASAARKTDPPIVTGYPYIGKDIYWIACKSLEIGLSDRAWKFSETEWKLPSGVILSRSGFRAVQAWLVEHNLAEAKPVYRLLVSPEVVADELRKP